MIDFLKFSYLAILTILGIYSIINFDKANKYIKLYSIITLIVEIIGYTYLHFNNKAFSFLYNIYSIVEILIWSLYFFYLNQISKRYLIPLLSCYFLTFFWLGDFQFFKLNNDGITLNSVYISTFIFLYFFNIIKKNLNLDGHFWILVGGLFYNFGGFILTGVIQIVAKIDNKLGSSLYSINSILNIIFYSLIFWGLKKLDKEFKNSLSN